MTSKLPPLRLVLDVQALQSELHYERGIARYVRQLSLALLAQDDVVSALFLNPKRPFPHNVPPELIRSGKLRWASAAALRGIARQGDFVYWVMSPFESDDLDPTLPIVADYAAQLVVTLYDLIPLLHPNQYLSDDLTRAYYDSKLRMVKLAGLALSISESARLDAIDVLGLKEDSVVSVGTGVSQYFNPSDDRESDSLQLKEHFAYSPGGFIFSVLGEDPRKNLDNLLTAYRLLSEDTIARYRLVVGGKYRPQSIQFIKDGLAQNIRERIHFTGYLADETLRAFYRECRLFVFPSRYEGFGLPLAEAMSCGAVCVCSNTSSIPEVLDEPSATFDPDDPTDIRDRIEQGLADHSLRRKLGEVARRRRNGFGWDSVARRSLEAIRSQGRGCVRKPSRTKPRIALGMVGPFPPLESGIADYNYTMARELAERTDLYLFYTPGSDPTMMGELGARQVLPLAYLGAHFSPHRLDHILYTFGNSDHHFQTYDKALEIPGVLWLHDAHLLESLCLRANQRGLDFITFVRGQYGSRTPPPISGVEPFDLEHAAAWGLHLTREIVRAARGVIVHSRYAAEMLRLDSNDETLMPPVWVLPLAVSSSLPKVRSPRRFQERPVVGAFGIVHKSKVPIQLLSAFAALSKRIGAELWFVGPITGELRQTLREEARAKGVSASVRIHGRVSQEKWCELMAATTCAVQLRKGSNGESSAAVNNCLAMGLPVITNVESCRELPPDVVVALSSSPTVEEIREALERLLRSPSLLAEKSAAGLSYARQAGPPEVARRLLEILEVKATRCAS